MMKKSLLLLIFCASALYLLPQNYPQKTPQEKAQYYTAEMVKSLQLDSTARPLVYEINLQVSTSFDSLYKLNPDKETARSGAIRIYRRRDSLLKQVLSPIQFLKFDDMQREKAEKRKVEKQKSKE